MIFIDDQRISFARLVSEPFGSGVQIKEIAERKMEDLNANDIDAAERIIQGTARSMGIEVE